MTDIEIIDLDSARGVSKSFVDFQTFIDTDAELKETQVWLDLQIGIVDASHSIQQAGTGAATDIKGNLKIAGSTIGKKWLTALKGVAISKNDPDMKKKLAKSPSEYEDLPENEWYAFNLTLLSYCTPHLSSVAKYGRTAAEISELTTINEAFKVAMPNPEKAIQVVAEATKKLKSAIYEINTRLREITDGLVKPYADMQPEFVAAYLKARKKPGK